MSLDALRKLRAQAEEAITMELAQITQELIRMERYTEEITAQIQSDATAYRMQAEHGLAIEDMLEWQARMDAQEDALVLTRQAIKTLTEAWAETQARLIEASQDRKILERLAERRQLAHLTDVARREQIMSDEVASRRHTTAEKLAS